MNRLSNLNASELPQLLELEGGVFGISQDMAVYPFAYHDAWNKQTLSQCVSHLAKPTVQLTLAGRWEDHDSFKVVLHLELSLGLQPSPQEVVRPPKPTPTTFSGGVYRCCDGATPFRIAQRLQTHSP